MLNENAIKRIKSIIESNTDNENIVTEVKLINNFSECWTVGGTRDAENIFFSYPYNAFVCLKDFTDEETVSVLDEANFEENTKVFKKGDVFILNENEEFYIYYCNISTDDVQITIKETDETKKLLQSVDIFERCQGVLDNCDSNKEIWEKIKKMVDIYFE